MAKITIVGAGGYVFPLRLIGDIFSYPELQDVTFALMDVDEVRLSRTASAARELIAHHGFAARVEVTTDRRRALAGADFVFVNFQVGGLDAYRLDVEIPRRYGLDQTVGDTLGPCGVFRFLRSAPAYRELADGIRDDARQRSTQRRLPQRFYQPFSKPSLGVSNMGSGPLRNVSLLFKIVAYQEGV